MRAIVIIACITMLGCATQWTHDTRDQQDFYRDKSTCMALAGQASGYHDPYSLIFAQAFKDCMRGEGYEVAQKG